MLTDLEISSRFLRIKQEGGRHSRKEMLPHLPSPCDRENSLDGDLLLVSAEERSHILQQAQMALSLDPLS